MIVKNISEEARYFTFVPRGYLLENFTRGRTLMPDEIISLPDNDSQIASMVQRYVDEGSISIQNVIPTPSGGALIFFALPNSTPPFPATIVGEVAINESAVEEWFVNTSFQWQKTDWALSVSNASGENKGIVSSWPGAVMARHPSGSGYVLANSSRYSGNAVGLAVNGAAPNFADDIQTLGSMTLDDWSEVTGSSTLGPLQVYFLDIISGKLATLPPLTSGAVCQQIGYAATVSTLNISIQPPILL